MSVLIVDRNPGLREAIARFLEKRGCWVTLATSAGSAHEAVRRQLFDVVVSDTFGLYEGALRLRPELRGRFIMISAEPRPAPETMKLFVDSEQLLLKPLSLAELWRCMEDIVARTHRPPSGVVPPPDADVSPEAVPGARDSGASPDLPPVA